MVSLAGLRVIVVEQYGAGTDRLLDALGDGAADIARLRQHGAI